MQPRKSLIEIFSTFLQFDADHFCGWATDAKLRRSMHSRIKQSTHDTSEGFWALYWYRVWQSQIQSVAKEHLIAYLQESCYWTSIKAAQSFASSQYKLADCFQIAIAQVDKVFKGFNPNQGFFLKNYASAIFSSIIRDTLRQRHEIDICSDWGLLRKISQKRLIESLQAAGLPPDTVTAYVCAWNCFKIFYTPTQAQGTRQLARPDLQTWEAIAQAYKSQTQFEVNPQTLETWLLSCTKAVRRFLYPSVTSINISTAGDDSTEWLDNIPANEQESLLNEIITQEEQQIRTAQLSELNTVLTTAVAQLEPQAQEILYLYYTQGLTQHQIAKQLQIQQYTVSRRLTKTREKLLQSLAQWSQQKLHISIDSDLLKSISTVMEEWLQSNFIEEGNGEQVIGDRG
ncbi:sigma-70 family RNA polymerase sigma factor [Chlorogloeopsis sp. ULAP02]|uniref:sigma-70 family RNA polymerase sigma factor n=1 Tax=Chlorogloeopsis sp. ULAP02 TaxID=3107926 RepID=UPI003134D079